MHIEKLSLINFKNYSETELELSPKINCFVGNNGGGKTNLLDAIHYLSFCKSFFNAIDSQNITFEKPFFVIQGIFKNGEQEDEIYCGLKRSQKKIFKRNKKEYTRFADHIGLFPLVMISPADSELINGESEIRRKFINNVIVQYNKDYLFNVINYNKTVLQRNNLLKSFAESNSYDGQLLDTFDQQLIQFGSPIYEERVKFTKTFIPIFQKYYSRLTNDAEQVSLEYHSQLNQHELAELLKKSHKKDRAAQYTTVGIHKDDLIFTISGFPIKKFGSQGQQKSFLTALKLAQFDFIKQIKGINPILLLDDIHDKLDEKRFSRLMQIVSSNNFGQVFITDTHQERIADVLQQINTDFKHFKVNSGEISVQ
jgi:DNA replication and repair protein RecF